MKSLFISGILLIVALLAGTYFVAGDAFVLGEDYINDLTMLAAVAIIVITTFVVLKYVNQIKNDKADGELVEDSWDNIGEYNNKVPTGWAFAFMATTIWALWYFFIGYPYNQFSQIGQWNEEVLEHRAKFKDTHANIDENGLVGMGESVFLVQCAPCHGVDAEGINNKAQNLVSRMSKTQVLDVIKNGSNRLGGYPMGTMPAGMASGADADKIATWIENGSKGTPPAEFSACASCHGADAKGMNGMSPDLTTYSNTLVSKVLENGKKGVLGTMPSFKSRLNDTQIKAVSTYIRSLGE
jgi:cytochrome c oxidase cbb3-type subunit 3